MNRILLVEDDNDFAAMIAEVVSIPLATHQPFTVDRVANVGEALTWLGSHRPSLVLLDLTLPDCNGMVAFHRIFVEATDIPVVILTGVDDEELALAMLQAGAQDYLVKSRVDILTIHRSLRYAMERHRLRHELTVQTSRIKAREQNLRQLIGRYHDGMIVTDIKHRTLFANPAAEAMLGKSMKELLGLCIDDLPEPGATSELGIICEEGQPGLASVRCLTTEWQGVSALLYSLQDITLLKQAEMELRKSADELELRVAARTAELASTNEALQREVGERRRVEDELRHAVDNLARSNIELERFAYIASHDLREPLRLIINYCDLLRRRCAGSLDDNARLYIQFAIEGANRLYDMINSLLDYSRLNVRTGQFALFDSDKVLRNVVEELRIGIEESNARISWGKLPMIYGNATLLMQVFQNLIGNAIKFRGAEAPCIDITAEHCDTCWRFRVRDNGIGMPANQTERVFQIFHRLHRSNQYPGSGIGLAICKKIVQHHGGRIWVESEPEQGASFFFTVLDKDAYPVESNDEQHLQLTS